MQRPEPSTLLKPRLVFTALFVVCAALIGYALYLQHAQALEPCPMCILQRYAFIAIAIVALIGALHNPGGLAVVVYGALIIVLALAGGGIAAWHSWLQHFPPPTLSCGTDLWYLLDAFPLSKALPTIFQGTGECSKVEWRLLGLSIPEWALVWFVIFGAITTTLLVKRRG